MKEETKNMKMKRTKKALSLFLCMAFIVAMALVTTGCSDKAMETTAATTAAETTVAETTVEETTAEETTAEDTTEAEIKESEAAEDVTILGEGSKAFGFGVFDLDGNETWFEIHTDEEMVGAALLTVELIDGEEGPYGLYVKTVNGITADYDVDQTYWAFYVNDEYATSGVDTTAIEEGANYSFRIAK